MENNLFLALLVFTHVCVFIKPTVGLPLLTDEATESTVESPRPPTAAMDYMQNIYHSKTADLNNGVKASTSNVWCFLPLTEGECFIIINLVQYVILSACVSKPSHCFAICLNCIMI